MYGYCPHCGAEVTGRTRGGDAGNDTCKAGHVYPSRLTLSYQPPATTEVFREAGQLLAAFEEVLGHVRTTDYATKLSLASGSPMLREMVYGTFLDRVRATRGLIDKHLATTGGAAQRETLRV